MEQSQLLTLPDPRPKMARLEAQIRFRQREIEAVRACRSRKRRELAPGGICPGCGQKLPEEMRQRERAAFEAQVKRELDYLKRREQELLQEQRADGRELTALAAKPIPTGTLQQRSRSLARSKNANADRTELK